MRAFILFTWASLVIATGYTLFHITFQVEELETELRRLNAEIREEQEAVHVLKAEWSYLNSPQRIEALTDTLLPNLQWMQPEQVMRIEDIPFRRPDHGTPPQVGSRQSPDRDQTGTAEAIPASVRSAQ